MIPRPEMIPKLDRKWSRTENDPARCGPQMIPPENGNGMEFGFLYFFFFNFLFHFYIYLFSSLNDELDKHNEKIFWRRKL